MKPAPVDFDRVLSIAMGADGGCSHCAASLVRDLLRQHGDGWETSAAMDYAISWCDAAAESGVAQELRETKQGVLE